MAQDVVLYLGCAFVTYVNNLSALEAINNLHDKVKLPNVSLLIIIACALTSLHLIGIITH